MSNAKPIRAMWLLNHSSLRKFEIPMLKKIGITEIFLPKIVPDNPAYRSSSIDYSEDANLSIPEEDLHLLNQVDWYENPTREATEIANKYFDIVFFIHLNTTIINFAKYFKGILIFRAYGWGKDLTYSNYFKLTTNGKTLYYLKSLGQRFWFGQVFENLKEVEDEFFQKQALYLPAGLSENKIATQWNGSNKSIFFICPDIAITSTYKEIYEQFKKVFTGLPYLVGGVQPVMPVNEPAVLGYISNEQFDTLMKEMRVMFYHSTEPRHLHYHPIEAIHSGMPLVFMAGGILDQLGGKSLPGRCKTTDEARTKIKRILNDDWELINAIKDSQKVILDSISWKHCESVWRKNFKKIFALLNKPVVERPSFTLNITKKIAVILPVAYRGGSLRTAKSIANAIYHGSKKSVDPVKVIFVYPENQSIYHEEDFKELHPSIQRRTFQWRTLTRAEARRAMRYEKFADWEPVEHYYSTVNDGIKNLVDCDLWFVVSDRLMEPLLPMRPIVHIIYDYVQRYIAMPHVSDNFLKIAKNADRVLVTTDFTRQDVIQYAGVTSHKVIKVPILSALFHGKERVSKSFISSYFLWTTNASVHKNHENTFKALQWYYEHLHGQLECIITGVNSLELRRNPPEYLTSLVQSFETNNSLKNKLVWKGDVVEESYQKLLSESAFLWHTASIDNGTGSVIEAATLGVPSLSSDYPAMREIDTYFAINAEWMDADDFKDMAKKLKFMELHYISRRDSLPSVEAWKNFTVEKLANEYWEAISECL